jgi:hypothetical protein
MKLAGVLLCAILLLCLYPTALAVEAGTIAVPSMPVPNMDMPKPLITKPSMDVPDTQPKPLSTLENNSAQVFNQSANSGEYQTKAAENEATAVSGKWSVGFDDLRDRSLDLTLWSSGTSKIMGFGTLTKDGIGISMSASGSFAEKKLVLAVKSAQVEYGSQNYEQYDLDMFMVDNTLSGTFILRSGSGPLVSGNATAIKR